MKLVALSNVEARPVSHGPGISKKVLAAAGDIPHLTQFAQSVFQPGEDCGRHTHADMWECFLVESGSGEIRVGRRRRRLEPGVFVMVEPGEAHNLFNTGRRPLVLTYFGVAESAPAHDARYWIRKLALRKHPEGGWFRETYRARESVPRRALPKRFSGPRCFSTQIHYLLESGDFSAFHRIRSDEVWHFHAGGPLVLHVLGARGRAARHRLGADPGRGQALQAVIPAGAWFAAEVEGPRSFALVSCTVAPGFEFEDFEIAKRSTLCELYPRRQALVRRLTRA